MKYPRPEAEGAAPEDCGVPVGEDEPESGEPEDEGYP